MLKRLGLALGLTGGGGGGMTPEQVARVRGCLPLALRGYVDQLLADGTLVPAKEPEEEDLDDEEVEPGCQGEAGREEGDGGQRERQAQEEEVVALEIITN